MARIVVIGAGTSGLVAAIALARRGHKVSVVEKDARPVRITSDNVFALWHRPGTPQALLPHGMMASARVLLRDRTPDLLAALYDAGAIDFDMSPYIPGTARVAADEDLRVVFCRRPLIESVFWDAAESERSLELHTSVAARGLIMTTERGAHRVTGVRIDTGAELHADLVVDASGRRSPIWKWLRDAGVPVADARSEPCGLVYYSRYYALRDGASLPRGPWLWGPRLELPYALAIVHLADRGVFSITIAIPTNDHELRALLADAAFDAACTALPALAPWVAVDRSIAISPVLAMGGLQNVLHSVVDQSESVVSGLLPLGDALCHTNAAYGWGMALGLGHAFSLVDALDLHSDPRALAIDYVARVAAENEARWRVASEQDRQRVHTWRGEALDHDDVPRAKILREVAAAMMLDPRVFRAVGRFSTLLDPAATLLEDAELLRLARLAVAGRPAVTPPAAPSRAELLASLR